MSVAWDNILNIHDPNLAINKLIALIQNLIKNAYVKPKINKCKLKPRRKWITTGIMESCRTKEKLYIKWNLNKPDKK